MDEYREHVKRVQEALDQDAAFIQPDPYLAQRVLNQARKEGEKTVKKKLTVGLVIAIVLMLATVTALALGIAHYFEGFAALEDTYGEYEQWPGSAKVELVSMMQESGVLTEAEAALWQPLAENGEKEATAEQVLAMHFAGMTYVDTYNAMTRELGPIETWTEEERALYTSILQKYGQQKMDWPVYLVPGDNDLNREEAVARAMEAAVAMFSVTEEELSDKVKDAIFAADAYNDYGVPADEPYWIVEFGNGYAYRVCMTRNGELLGLKAPQTQVYRWGSELAEGATDAEPGANDVTREQAITEARNALTEITNVPVESVQAMDVTTRFVYCDSYCRGHEPVWIVSWSRQGEPAWNVLLGYDGSYIDAEPAGKLFDQVQRRYTSLSDLWRQRCGELGMTENYFNAKGNYYFAWSLEEKAAFTQMWTPIVNEYVAAHPYFHGKGSAVWEWTRNVNGLPDENAIDQNTAVQIALQAIEKEFGDKLSAEKVYVFYFVTDPEKPEWRIANASRYVTLDAHTGEVLAVERNGKQEGELHSINDFLMQ